MGDVKVSGITEDGENRAGELDGDSKEVRVGVDSADDDDDTVDESLDDNDADSLNEAMCMTMLCR